MHSVIIGTAGHVDHGKTELIKALTGWETDRLEEEKRRGISIVLGFAPLALDDGTIAGVVDVPGHERFVKNMVSGAVGVDLALLVVAADEGVMPQTEEHLEVLRLLGVRRGVVAITKVDLVDDEIIEVVESEVRDLLRRTPMRDVPLVRTSIITGRGLDDLRAALSREAGSVVAKTVDDFFRMPVDRVFTRSGIGTIVTGTTWSGRVSRGDELVVEPLGRMVRIREVQSFDRAIDTASAGIRAAIALHGVKVSDVGLGSQVLTPGKLERSSMVNASVEVSMLAGSALKNRQRVRFHHAAAEIMARVVLLDRETMGVGDRGFIQLRLEKPTVARRGDRFVLRSYSPMRVVAGGTILDPVAAKERRYGQKALDVLTALDSGSDRDAVLALSSRSGASGVSLESLIRFGMKTVQAAGVVDSLEKQGRIAVVGGRIVETGVLDAAYGVLLDEVKRFHGENTLLWGIDREELKERLALGEGPLYDFFLERGRRNGELFFRGGRIRAGSGERDLTERDRGILADLERKIRDAGFSYTTRGELAGTANDEKALLSYLHILQEEGTIVRISSFGFMHREHFTRLIDRLAALLKNQGEVSVSDFKELFGFSRKFAVPLLEYLDEEGYTVRHENVRTAGSKLSTMLR